VILWSHHLEASEIRQPVALKLAFLARDYAGRAEASDRMVNRLDACKRVIWSGT